MSHKIRDGIVIDSTIYMLDGKRKGFPLQMRLLQLFILMAGCYSIISIFIEAFSLQVRSSHLQTALFLISILIYLLFFYPAYDGAKFAVATTVYLMVVRRFFEQLENGFYLLENAILEEARDYYNFSTVLYKAEYSTAKEDITLLMIMILIPIIALLAYSLIRCRWINITTIITILPVAASFAVGKTPSEGFLITYLLTIVFLSRSYGLGKSGSYKEQKFMVYRINNRAALMLSLIILGIFLIMKLIIPEEHYDNTVKIKEAKVEIQDFMMNFSLQEVSDRVSDITWLPKKSNLGSGGLNSGKLGRVDQVSYKETEQLKLVVPLRSVTEGIYLKGYVGSVYTGDSWEEHNSATMKKYEKLGATFERLRFEPVNQTVSLLNQLSDLKKEQPLWMNQDIEAVYQQKFEFIKGTIGIEYVDANKNYIYAPYLTNFNASETAKYKQDLYAVPLAKEKDYEFDFYFNLNIHEEISEYIKLYKTSLGELSEAEQLYRSFVYEAYTQLPKEGLSRLKEDFNRDKIGIRVDNIQKAISYVKDYLHSNTNYTLSPGKLPKDKDFVEYFLYENKVGYCSHYASAATMMLRSLGYPARYVEGYVATARDVIYTQPVRDKKVTVFNDRIDHEAYETQVEVSVKDYNAHAWVEIYMDGFGWFPVEFTPSAGLDNTEEIIGDVGGVSEELRREEETRITPTPEPIDPTPIVEEPEEEMDKESPDTEEKREEQEDQSTAGQEDLASHRAWYIILFITTLMGVGIAIFYRNQRKRTAPMDNRNKKAILIYKEIERLFIFLNALPKRSRCLEDHLEYIKDNCLYIDTGYFDSMIETVKKARFGRYIISRRELDQIEDFYKELSARAYQQLPFWKRVIFRIVLLR